MKMKLILTQTGLQKYTHPLATGKLSQINGKFISSLNLKCIILINKLSCAKYRNKIKERIILFLDF
jgi:hypothetical protein